MLNLLFFEKYCVKIPNNLWFSRTFDFPKREKAEKMDEDADCYAMPGSVWNLLGYKKVKQELDDNMRLDDICQDFWFFVDQLLI